MTEKHPADKRITKGTVHAGGVTPKTPPPPAPHIVDAPEMPQPKTAPLGYEPGPYMLQTRIHDARLLAEVGIQHAQSRNQWVTADWAWVESQFRAIVRVLDGEG